MTKIEARRLKGFQDYEPRHMALRYKIMDAVRHEAEKAGFAAIGTPALEYSEVLLGVGGETDKQVFRFADNGKRDVALRFDLTIPFSRFVAENHGTLPMPFKRLQIGDVWRAEKPQRGRYREFCQCDLDIAGVESMEADIEILLCLQNVVASVLDESFTMYMGNRLLLSGLLQKLLGPLSAEQESQALIIVDKLDKIGAAAIIAMLQEELSVSQHAAEQLMSCLIAQRSGDFSTIVECLNEEQRLELNRLQETASIVKDCLVAAGHERGKVKIDLAIARGLGYYTGIVFETKIDSQPDFGSICSGGRYDHLVERFLSENIPGVGGSLGLDRLAAYLLTKESSELAAPLVYVAVASPAERAMGFSLLQKLRTKGVKAEIHLKEQKLGQQFKRANKLGCRFVVTIGESERLSQRYSLKDMTSGQEKRDLSIDDLMNSIPDSKNQLP